VSGNGPGSGSHRCPVRACTTRVSPDKLMCRAHWYQVPKPIRDAVWATWRSGAGAGSEGHRLACDAAVRAVNARQEDGRS
jgi:hypothetical protein